MFKQVIEVLDRLDSPSASGETVRALFREAGWDTVESETIQGPRGQTDFITVIVPGLEGRRSGGAAPTIAIVGCLGSIGARPEVTGMVSDADGAVVALAAGLKLVSMHERGDRLKGDVVVTTHVSPKAATSTGAGSGRTRMMPSPVEGAELRRRELTPDTAAVLSVDATKANRVFNQRGFAISPTVKEGYILHASEDLLEIMEIVTGQPPVVLPLAQQDIVPGREVRHINGIMGPSTATDAPVVGIAITSGVAVPGIASGANQAADLELAARFCVEVAKVFGEGRCRFYDEEQFAKLVQLYGPMKHFQTSGRPLAGV